jgi:hypothetical protein
VHIPTTDPPFCDDESDIVEAVAARAKKPLFLRHQLRCVLVVVAVFNSPFFLDNRLLFTQVRRSDTFRFFSSLRLVVLSARITSLITLAGVLGSLKSQARDCR